MWVRGEPDCGSKCQVGEMCWIRMHLLPWKTARPRSLFLLSTGSRWRRDSCDLCPDLCTAMEALGCYVWSSVVSHMLHFFLFFVNIINTFIELQNSLVPPHLPHIYIDMGYGWTSPYVLFLHKSTPRIGAPIICLYGCSYCMSALSFQLD